MHRWLQPVIKHPWVKFISKTDEQDNEQYLSIDVVTIPRTHQLHCFIPGGKYRMKVAENLGFKRIHFADIRNNTEKNIGRN